MWQGDYGFLLSNLVKRDFKTRYRNMSLGIFWSLLNPLVTMGVLVFVYGKIRIFSGATPHFAVFILCGLVPLNFFSMAWSTGTSSFTDNAGTMKRVPIPRLMIPIATVLGNCLHLAIQIGLLLAFTLASGLGVNWHWLWLPVVWLLYIVFVCGLAMISAAINVYVRDTRYIVEAFNTVLFWLVPIVYYFSQVPQQFRGIYELNPVAALCRALRKILMESTSPDTLLLVKLCVSSFVLFGIGWLVLRKLGDGFFEFL
jgi:lipopolysaccharide transport system permease protein